MAPESSAATLEQRLEMIDRLFNASIDKARKATEGTRFSNYNSGSTNSAVGLADVVQISSHKRPESPEVQAGAKRGVYNFAQRVMGSYAHRGNSTPVSAEKTPEKPIVMRAVRRRFSVNENYSKHFSGAGLNKTFATLVSVSYAVHTYVSNYLGRGGN